MKKITIALILFVSLTLFSNKLFSQQNSSNGTSTEEQVKQQKAKDAAAVEDLKDERNDAKEVKKDAHHAENVASDASKKSKSALKSEKKAQKARTKADKQKIKAEKARNESTK